MTTDNLPVLAILGGTGDLGTGLARRWAQAGYQVIIGSRTQEKAETAVQDLQEIMGNLLENAAKWASSLRTSVPSQSKMRPR